MAASPEERARRPRSSAREMDIYSVLQFNEGMYRGEVDKDTGLPHGEGCYRYHCGDVYTGSFLNNMRHGYGKMVYNTGQCYEGKYKFNVPSGPGQLIQANMDQYVGSFRKGVFDGQGKLVYANGNVYQGSFRRGRKHGFGCFTYANRDVYEGWYRHDVPHGTGRITFFDSGYSEEGQFINGTIGELHITNPSHEGSDPGAKHDGVESSEESDEEREDSDSDDENDDEQQVRENLLRATLSPAALEAIRNLGIAAPPLKEPSSSTEEGRGKTVHLTAKTNKDFGRQEYWESRFATEEEYDWLLTFAQVKSHLVPYLPSKTLKILIVGCGNSSFSADLYDAGYTNITNLDSSAVVIEKMRRKHESDRPLMAWVTMDMTATEFEPGCLFDVIIDKAAMDALMVDEGDVWDPKESVCVAADKMCLEMRRLLPSNGLFLQISFMQPHFRTKYLMGIRSPDPELIDADPYSSQVGLCSRYDWTLKVENIDVEAGCLSSFLYHCACPDWTFIDPNHVEKRITRKERSRFINSPGHSPKSTSPTMSPTQSPRK
jgi:SAM-dependent methyltransferase